MSNQQKRDARAVWGASPAGTTHAAELKPGSREFFERVLERRSTEELPWLADVVPFADYSGKSVLELGCGAGYDAHAFCLHGCDYTGIDITPQNPVRTRSHLAFYGMQPGLAVADAERLPWADSSFDLVYSMGVLHHVADTQRTFEEALRVLRPGGEFCLGLYHRDSIFYWGSLWLHDHLLRGGFRQMPFAERLARIEYTESDRLPVVKVYGRGEVRRMLHRAGFESVSTRVRKLVPADLPGLPHAISFYRRIPRSWLDTVGRLFGWYVMARATRPRR